MQRFVGFLQANVGGEQQLLVPFGGAWGFLGDWVTPHGNEESGTPESILFNNCILAYLLVLVADAADALGDAGGAAGYRAAHAALGASIHAAFYNATAGHYLDSLQTHAVLPLVAGPSLRPPCLAASPTRLSWPRAATSTRA